MRMRFEASVDTGDLMVKIGKWRESAERPRPAWTMLSAAKVWKLPKFSALRDVLRAPRALPTLTTSSDAAVRGVGVPNDGSGHSGTQVDIYKAGGSVPEALMNRTVRLAVIHVDGPTRTVVFFCGQHRILGFER